MEENIDHNQSGLPIKEEEQKEITQQEQFKIENETQESGPIDIENQPEPVNMADIINQVPKMIPSPDMIGAIKIKDALFIGDELASQDLEFVVTNKVSQ